MYFSQKERNRYILLLMGRILQFLGVVACGRICRPELRAVALVVEKDGGHIIKHLVNLRIIPILEVGHDKVFGQLVA